MAQPARRSTLAVEEPPIDPSAVDRAYSAHRARRQARVEASRSRRRARIRFWIVLLVLLGAAVFLALTVWREIQRLFGL